MNYESHRHGEHERRRTTSGGHLQRRTITSEWKVVAENRVQRPLKGAEIVVNYTEEKSNGSFQLAISGDMVSNLPASFFKSRFATVIYLLRQRWPEVAMELAQENLDVISFTALRNVTQAEEWLRQSTRIVEDGSTVQEVRRHVSQLLLDSPHKMNRYYLVLHPRSGNPGIVVHSSHAVGGHRSAYLMSDIAELYMANAANKSVQEIFTPEVLPEIIPRLPQTLTRAYSDKFNPGAAEKQIGTKLQQVASSRNDLPSIGIPVTPSWQTRVSKTHNLHCTLEPAASRVFRSSIKHDGLSFTEALNAAVISTIATHYPTNSDVGAHVCFSANGRRWVSTEGRDGSAPVGMAILPAGFYLDPKKHGVRLDARSRPELVALARAVGSVHLDDLKSPHLMSVLEELGNTWRANSEAILGAQPSLSKPIITSQGDIPVIEASNARGDFVRVADIGYAGRTAAPDVCFASHTCRGRMHIDVGFDERFFPYEEMHSLFGTLMSRLFTLADSSSQPSHL